MDLHDLSEKFYQSKTSVGRSPYTIITYRKHIKDFLQWCDVNEYTESDLTGMNGAETIEEHFFYLRAVRSLSAATVVGRFRALRALYRWIEGRVGPFTEGNPFTWLTQPDQPSLLPKHISYQDLTLLLHSIKGDQWLDHRDRLMIKSLFFTGLRAGELLSLHPQDVDYTNRQLRVMRWKTGIEQVIPLSVSLAAEFRVWIDAQRPACAHDGLWPSADGYYRVTTEPLQYGGMRMMLRRRCGAMGMKVYLPHAFRHGCAVYIIQRGGDLSLVKDLLGHQDISTTQVYLRFDVSRMKGQYDRIFE